MAFFSKKPYGTIRISSLVLSSCSLLFLYFILDKKGKIVAKNLRGKALTDKLEEMLIGKKKQSIAMPMMGM